jgi:hydrogenase nickel incorporation protein HypB
MCGVCGCETHDPLAAASRWPRDPVAKVISLEQDLLAKNDQRAAAIRARLERDAIATFNLIGSPGAGKTTLLERTIRALAGSCHVTVIEGDQATDHDARRIRAAGCRVVQINTGVGCHLDATHIERGLAELAPPPSSMLFVENVGNLVCPAMFDLGERAKVVVMSVTEGEDKPLKYPHVFQAARAMVLTKADLLPYLELDVGALIANARHVRPDLAVFPVSATKGEGMTEWCNWLRGAHA